MDEFQTIVNLIGSGFIVWAAVVGAASVAIHFRVFDRHSTMSVHLLCYMGAMAAVLVLSCIRIFTGDSWWFQLLRLATFMAVPVFMTQRLYLQLQAQRRGSKPPAPTEGED